MESTGEVERKWHLRMRATDTKAVMAVRGERFDPSAPTMLETALTETGFVPHECCLARRRLLHL
eukprot:12902638-Prorocentrum_lima.AAC.1